MITLKHSTLAICAVLALTLGSCSKNATVPVDKVSGGSDPQTGAPTADPNGQPTQTPKSPRSSSCTMNSVEQIIAGGVIKCDDGSKIVIRHGENGEKGSDGRDGRDGKSCSVARHEAGAIIQCSDGTEQIVTNGKNGNDGLDGTSCSVEEIDNGAMVVCTDGSKVPLRNGKDGVDGTSCSVTEHEKGALITCTDGTEQIVTDGKDGLDGTSCSAKQTEMGAQIQCSDGSEVTIANGKDGRDGKDGTSCSVAPHKDGALVSCSDGTRQVVTNGRNGNDGLDGKNCSVTEVNDGAIISCGDSSVVIKNGAPGKPGTNGGGQTCQPNLAFSVKSTPVAINYKGLPLPYRTDSKVISTIGLNDVMIDSTFGNKYIKDSQVVFGLEVILTNKKFVRDTLRARFRMKGQKISTEGLQHKDTELLCLPSAGVCSGEYIFAEGFQDSRNNAFDVRSTLYSDSMINSMSSKESKSGSTLYVSDNLNFEMSDLFSATRSEVLDMIYSSVSDEQSSANIIKTIIPVVIADDTYVVDPELIVELEINTCDPDMDTATRTQYETMSAMSDSPIEHTEVK